MAAQPILASVEVPRGKATINKYLIILAVMLPASMEILDTSVVNVSLQHIGGSLGSSALEATWVITSYLIANAIMVPLGGWLSHRFGRRNLLLSAVAGFTISSVLCGLAPNLLLLVIFRVLQGLTGGGLQPLSQAVLNDEFPGEKRQRAMSFWAVGVVLAPTLGPTLGGWITDSWSWHGLGVTGAWRWIFFINLPMGILGWKLISKYVYDPEHVKDGKAADMDVIGILFLALGMGALQIVFDKGEQEDWYHSNVILGLIVAAVVLLSLLVMRQLRASNPFIRIRLFADWNFAWGSCIGFLMYSTLFASIILVPFFMETVLGWSAMTTGICTAPRGLGSLFAILLQLPKSLRLQKILRSPWLALGGFAVSGCVFIMGYSHLNMYSGPWDFFWPQCIQGFASTLSFLPIVVGATITISKDDMKYATSLYGAIRNIGSSAGVSFVAIFLDRRNRFHQNVLAAHAFPGNPAFAQRIQGLQRFFIIHGANAQLAYDRGPAFLYEESLRQANIQSFLDAFHVFGLVLLGVSVLFFAVEILPQLLRRMPRR